MERIDMMDKMNVMEELMNIVDELIDAPVWGDELEELEDKFNV